jgi:hypothetical protein
MVGEVDKTTDPVPVADPEMAMVPEEVMGELVTVSQDGTEIPTDETDPVCGDPQEVDVPLEIKT